MRLYFFLFIAAACAIIIGSHLAAYFSWMRFFKVVDPGTRRWIGIGLGVLSITFIVSFFLIHWRVNSLTTAIYAISAVWLGIFFYLFLSMILTWMVKGVLVVVPIKIDFRLVAALFVAAALAYSAYGLWNAQNPRIVHVVAPVKNLPESWEGKKIAQISDVHLGTINGPGFMRRIVEKVKEVAPDAVFITGDLFDGNSNNMNALVEPLRDLRPPLGMYFVTGNHEVYAGRERCLQALAKMPITILRNQVINLAGIQLVGIDYPAVEDRFDVAPEFPAIDTTLPTIVLFHAPTSIEKFRRYGANLQISGHTHVGQMWPFCYITHSVYSGHDYGLHVYGDYVLYTSSGAGTWGPPLRTGKNPEIAIIELRRE